MDILAARKRAAELAKKQIEPKEALAAPVSVPEQPEPAPQPPRVQANEDVPQPAPVEASLPQQVPEPETQTYADADAGAEIEEEAAEPAVPDVESLAVRIATEEYLMPIEQVREVLKIREATPVPHAPEHSPGVISLRGDILPVIDLGKRLGLPQGTRDDKSRIVVVGLDDEDAGLIVDRVTGVVRFPADAVGPAPENVEQGGGAEYLKGIVRKEGKLYILLDIEKAAGK